jgi:hypothetical protein
MIQRNLLTWWPNFNSRIRTLTDSPHVSRYRSCLLVGLAYRDNNFRLVNGSIATREGKGGSQLRRLIASWSVCFGRAVNMVAWEVNEDQALSCQTLGARERSLSLLLPINGPDDGSRQPQLRLGSNTQTTRTAGTRWSGSPRSFQRYRTIPMFTPSAVVIFPFGLCHALRSH